MLEGVWGVRRERLRFFKERGSVGAWKTMLKVLVYDMYYFLVLLVHE